MMRCWSCEQLIEGPVPSPFPFRETCPHCHGWLHACRNCQFFDAKLGEGCEVMTADFVGDKKAFNQCEDFVLRANARVDAEPESADKHTSPRQRFDDLFG